MFKENDVIARLINLLKEQNIPKNSIVVEWPIGKGRRVDLAIIDPKINKALALFEIKNIKNEKNLNFTRQQLENYSKILGDLIVPLYIVFPKETPPGIELIQLNQTIFEKGEPDLQHIFDGVSSIPDYSILKQSRLEKDIEKTQEKKETEFENINKICLSFAGFLNFILFLDIFISLYSFVSYPTQSLLTFTILSVNRLILIAIIVGLIIIPYASKLKILNLIEWEAKNELEKEKKS
jgi:hypothetical protein